MTSRLLYEILLFLHLAGVVVALAAFLRRPEAAFHRDAPPAPSGDSRFPHGCLLPVHVHLCDQREHGLRPALHDVPREPAAGAEQHAGAALRVRTVPAASRLRHDMVRPGPDSPPGRSPRGDGPGARARGVGARPGHGFGYSERPRIPVFPADRGATGPRLGLPGAAPGRPGGGAAPTGHLVRNPRRRSADHDFQLLAGHVQPAHPAVRHRGDCAGIRSVHGARSPGVPMGRRCLGPAAAGFGSWCFPWRGPSSTGCGPWGSSATRGECSAPPSTR